MDSYIRDAQYIVIILIIGPYYRFIYLTISVNSRYLINNLTTLLNAIFRKSQNECLFFKCYTVQCCGA